MIRPPRYVAVVIATALLSLVIAVAVAWQVARQSNEEEMSDCARSVAVREDNRAMWTYLLSDASADLDRVARVRAELERRLPELECVDGNPVPVEP